MNKTTVRIVAGTIATAVLGLVALTAPAQADTAWNPTSPKDTSTSRIIGAPAMGGAGTYRIIG